MSTIQNLFQQAQLAEAAYADFSNPDGVNKALTNAGFSTAQATDFANQWQVVSQYTASPRRAHSLAVRRMKGVNQ